MNKYSFRLTPSYCLYNGAAVMEQKGSSIKFITENKDEVLEKRLEKAFLNFLEYVRNQKDCPEDFFNKEKIEFEKGNRLELRNFVSRLYTERNSGDENDRNTVIAAGEKKNEAAAVLLLDAILNEARKQEATDIHVENNVVRFRVKGSLESIYSLDKKTGSELIRRIKYLAGMNVLEKRKSQDGHFVYGEKEPLYIRVSAVGVIGSYENPEEESLVVRLLDTNRVPLELEYLGFNELQVGKIQELCNERNGLIVICGPTGAGKSTTAASLLKEIQKQKAEKIKIISMEDPPEYVLKGVTQIQINEKSGNSYSQALSHVFRQDPDVIMIGEIRDEESAQTALRAALTGHLVIATLHTDTASGAVLRLEDLGVHRKLIVSVLKGVIVQEMNYVKDVANLLADVSLPEDKLYLQGEKELSRQQMDECFTHITNYKDVVDKSIRLLKKKMEISKDEKVRRNFIDGIEAKEKIHRRFA